MQTLSKLGQFLSQYLLPTALSTLIASALAINAAISTAREQQRTYNEKFENLLTDKAIITTFEGSNVQSVRESQATATLIALQSMAETEAQRRTVLLLGAKLLNADPDYVGTGSDAARLLTLLINEADLGRSSWSGSERGLNQHLWSTVTSASFMDLVTAGYENNYYNDDYSRVDLRPYLPTLNGDAPISHDAKFEVLWEITAPQYDGWVHLATFRYKLEPKAKSPAQTGNVTDTHLPVPATTAIDFIRDIADVSIKHDVSGYGNISAQYAIPDPRATPLQNPIFSAGTLIDPKQFPAKWIMLKHRLLRERPPVEYVNPDGSFRKGSLGRVIGVVPAGSCISVVEPLTPVLVFVPMYAIEGKPAPAATSSASTELGGLVHMWAHVRASKDDAHCLATIGNTKS
jgi:hypothetical protein